ADRIRHIQTKRPDLGPAAFVSLHGGAATAQRLGQQRLPFGPRWNPGGQARPTAKGWQWPPGPRHLPGPHPSAILVIALSVLPIGAGMTLALAAVARPTANAALKTIVFIMVQLSPVSKPSRTHPLSGIGRCEITS